MKKLSILLFSTVALLTGCAEDEIKKTTDSVFKSANQLEEVKENEFNQENKDLYASLIDSLGIEKSTVKLEELEEYKKLESNISNLQSSIEFEINEIKMNESKNKAKVDVDLKYTDIGGALVQNVGESLDRSLLKVYSGGKADEKEFLKNASKTLNDTVSNAIKTIDEEIIKELKGAEITVVKKDKEWIVKDVDEKIIEALTFNFSNEQKTLIEEKAKEVKDNRAFLETEVHLKEIFNEVKTHMNKNKIDMKEIQNKSEDIHKLIKDKLDVSVKVSPKNDKEENVFYIVPNEQELSVSVVKDGQQFTFSDKLK